MTITGVIAGVVIALMFAISIGAIFAVGFGLIGKPLRQMSLKEEQAYDKFEKS